MSKVKRLAVWLVLLILALGLFGPGLAPYRAGDFSFEPLQAPGIGHWLGTNSMGQDVLSGLLVGFRLTLGIALVASVCSTLVGLLTAFLAAYYGGWAEHLFRGLTDLFLIVPEILVVMLFAAFAGPRVWNIVLVMCLFSWSRAARLLLARIKVALLQENVQYAILLKAGPWHLVCKVLVPIRPMLATVFVQQFSRAAVYEASLAFLGLGDATLKSWGRMIRMALDYEGIFWTRAYLWWLLPPIACLLLLVSCLAVIAFEENKA